MGVHHDLTGFRYGSLVLTNYVGVNLFRQALWAAQCDCGGTTVVLANKARRGTTQSCGCGARNIKVEMVGQRFARLVVQSESLQRPTGRQVMWVVRCDCGTELAVSGAKLRSGHTQSCGCRQREMTSARSITHGMSKTRLYQVFKRMWQRCTNPNTKQWADYGGRGITVCKRWERFENFYADMGECPPGLTIERKNNDKGYSPKNCIWADRMTQSKNKRPRKDRRTKEQP